MTTFTPTPGAASELLPKVRPSRRQFATSRPNAESPVFANVSIVAVDAGSFPL